MPTIVKKGTNPSAFRLNKRTIICEPNVITVISDEEYAELKEKYGAFIEPRIITEKNPCGCFLVSERSQSYVSDMNKEVGEVKDNSARVDLDEEKAKKKRKKR